MNSALTLTGCTLLLRIISSNRTAQTRRSAPANPENISILVFDIDSIYAMVYIFLLRSWQRLPPPKPEVVCVTGLPARTARPFVPLFLRLIGPMAQV